MTKVMNGVRVLEIAQHTFVPSAGALLSDWGADVIKIEHPLRSDAIDGDDGPGSIALRKRHAHVLPPDREFIDATLQARPLPGWHSK